MPEKSIEKLIAFVRETFGAPEAFIPLHDPRFIGNEKKYLNDCIDSNFVSSVGEYVAKFEKACADYTGSEFAVAAMNGTAALHIALMLSGVNRDDEVITQPLTFIATANAISYTGAHPVFVDVDKETMGISPSALDKWLTENAELTTPSASTPHQPTANGQWLTARSQEPRAKSQWPIPINKSTRRRISAVVPMHTFGHPVKMNELLAVCEKWNIPCIEDAAESLGSYYKGKHTGTLGKFGILSFNGNKIVTCGGGGMILTHDESLAKIAKHLTTQAKIPHAWEFVHDHIGYNYRLTNISAALGCAQMETMNFFIQEKRKLAALYKNFFKNSDFEFFSEPADCESNYWLNLILAKDRSHRDEILKATNAAGVMTRPAWELMNRLPMFKNCQCGPLPSAEWLADRIVNIPSSVIVKGYRSLS
jgi:dTDP-4-amino-4,6-dideoxygalactose transaminase